MMDSDRDLLRCFEHIDRRISIACTGAGRLRDEVKLLAVSKGQSEEAIAQLYQAGQRDFGENYLGEMLAKQKRLLENCPEIRWHFIGQIQTNKAEKIARHSFMVHSVGSLKQALGLAKYRQTIDPLRVLLQVNLDGHVNRGGVDPTYLNEFFESTSQLAGLRVIGLMTILPLISSTSKKQWFAQLRILRDELEKQFQTQLPELSMGMSEDFEVAIECGATWVRIGSALFGLRR